MTFDEIQKLIDKSGGPRLDGEQQLSSIASSLRAIAQLLLNQARGNERGASLASAIDPLRASAKQSGHYILITPNAALDGALVTWPPDTGRLYQEPEVLPIKQSVLEDAYLYFEHFCAAGWMLDLRFKGVENQPGDGHKHAPTAGNKCCYLCGIDWRRVK